MIKLFNGDCLEVMDYLITKNYKFNSVITDPPYGTTKCPWDSIIPFSEMWERIHKLTNPESSIILFGNEPFSSQLRISNIKNYKYDWYWEKERLTNIAQVKRRAGKTIENIMVFYKKQCKYNPQMIKYTGPLRSNKVKNGKLGKLTDTSMKKVKEYKDTGYRYPTQILKFKRDILTSNLHPTQKPLLLMEYLIKTYTDPGDLILDFTMGSGTTGLACKNLERDFFGIELNKEYFEICKKRLL